METARFIGPTAPTQLLTTPRLRVLLIDDDKNIRRTLEVCLEHAGCDVVQADSADGALRALERERCDLALLDLHLGRERGQDLIPRLVALCPGMQIVVITAYATIESVVETLRLGAWDYLAKPLTPDHVRQVLARLRDRRLASLDESDPARPCLRTLAEMTPESQSPAVRNVMATIARAAQSDAPVLLRGETGTGKTMFAQAVHGESPRRDNPFVVVNCPTLSEELLASELFGHAKGAFTGAVRDQMGRVETAHGGTLFLDEIGEIPVSLQAKLLRFLQEKRYERIGENQTRHSDVRIVTATNRNIEDDITNGRFREDLYFRLNVIDIDIPSVRDRPEDILPLARHFIETFATRVGCPVPHLSKPACDILQSYSWPGNIRELRNTIERAVILWPTDVIGPEALPDRLSGTKRLRPFVGGDCSVHEIEQEHILRVVNRTPTLDKAAEILGIDYTTLWRKRKRYLSDRAARGIHTPDGFVDLA